jgi:hypothetical protein
MAQRSAHAMALLAEATREMELVLLHRCRGGRAPYDWRATVGRFVCRGCGIVGVCGACAEMRGQRITPGVVPALCAFHGGLLEIGIADVALAVDFPAPILPARRPRRASLTQLALLPSIDAVPQGKEDARQTTQHASATTQ